MVTDYLDIIAVDNLLFTRRFGKDQSIEFTCCGIKKIINATDTITIPSQIKVDNIIYKVTGIGYEFELPSVVKTLVVSEGIEEIDSYCFCNSNLVTVILPNSLKKIEKVSFYSCSNLENVTISENTGIGDSCFLGSIWYINLISTQKRSGEVIYVGKTLIGWKGILKSLKIKPGTEDVIIHPDTELECLEEIHIPRSIKKIELQTKSLDRLKKIYIEDLNSYSSIIFPTREDSLFNFSDNTKEIYIEGKKTDSLIINNTRTFILENWCFYNSSTFKNIIIGDGVTMFNTDSIDKNPIQFLKISGNTTVCGQFSDIFSLKELHISYKTVFRNKFMFSNRIPSEKLRITIDIDHDINIMHTYELINLIKCLGNNLDIKLNFSGEKEGVDGYVLSNFINLVYSRIPNINFYLDRTGYHYVKLSEQKITAHHLNVPRETYHSYCRLGWNTIATLHKYSEDDISYVFDEDDNSYKVTCKVDNFGENNYRGIIKVPKYIIVDKKYFNITKIDNFAFSDCSGLEKVLIPNSVKIESLALFNNDTTVIETYEDVDNM